MESPFSVVSVSFSSTIFALSLPENAARSASSKPWMSLAQPISVISPGPTVIVSPSTLTSAPKWLQP